MNLYEYTKNKLLFFIKKHPFRDAPISNYSNLMNTVVNFFSKNHYVTCISMCNAVQIFI